MKITKKQLNKLILNELFDIDSGHSYPFKIEFSSADKIGKRNPYAKHKILSQTVTYNFKTGTGKYPESLTYDVMITLSTINFPWDVPDPMNPDHYYWEISFQTMEEWQKMTNRSDSRVLPTIANIILHFFNRLLPTLEDNDVKTFGFEGIEEVGREKAFTTNSKRTRVYALMIARYAKQLGLNIVMSKGSTGENSVLFKVN